MPWMWDFGASAGTGEKIACFPSTSLKQATEARPKEIYAMYPEANIYTQTKPKLGETSITDKVINMIIRKFPDGVDSTTDTPEIRVRHFSKCLETLPADDTVVLFDVRDLTGDMIDLLRTKYGNRRRKVKLDISSADKGITLFEIDFKSS